MMKIIQIFVSVAYIGCMWLLIRRIDPRYAAACEQKKTAGAFAAAYLVLTNLLCLGTVGIWFESIFWATLTLAAFVDYCTTDVYDFIFCPPLIMGCVYLAEQGAWKSIINLLVFFGVQYIIFRKLYGGADCLAFSMGAVYMAADNRALMSEFLLLMLFTFMELGIVQLFKGNVNRKGNLKQPVPLIPYIAFALAIWQGYLSLPEGKI